MKRWQIVYQLDGDVDYWSEVVHAQRIDEALNKANRYIYEKHRATIGNICSVTTLPPPKLKAEPLPDQHA